MAVPAAALVRKDSRELCGGPLNLTAALSYKIRQSRGQTRALKKPLFVLCFSPFLAVRKGGGAGGTLPGRGKTAHKTLLRFLFPALF